MAVLSEGEIHQVGTPEEVYQNPNDEFVADFIGSTNHLTGTITDSTIDDVHISIEDNLSILVNKTQFPSSEIDTGSTVTVILRPEQISLGEQNDRHNSLDGVIEEVTYLGSTTEYDVTVEDLSIIVQQQNVEESRQYSSGDEVTLGFRSSTPAIYTEDV
jgi:ABC-type Fe3+/spermidine/putrescine transport system ATPase subunit